jgi:cyclic-di-GMP phosphodiesterase TipF (flagellum assembly factor)
MPLLFHTIIFLSYLSMAVAVAVVVPQSFPDVGQSLSVVIGGVVLVAGGLVHELFARLDSRRQIMERVSDLYQTHDMVMDELWRARGETRRIHEALEGMGRTGNARNDISKVAAEVKALEKLVKQISGQSGPDGDAARTAEVAATTEVARRAPPHKVASGLDDTAILDLVREGLKNGRVDLFLQPIVSLPQRKPRYYECFSRIRVDDETVIVPEQYLGIAEREGLIAAIDNMLLFRCVQLVRRTQRRQRNVGFFCNISPHSLADKPFLSDFVDYMAFNTDLAAKMVFEFGQSAFDAIDDEVFNDLERLTSLGFRFSVDQVTSLDLKVAELARRRVKFIKVNAKLLLAHARGQQPGTGLRELKKKLDRFAIDLIAEKIEDQPMLIELLDSPIDFGQGHLLGEPRLSRKVA